AARRPLPLTVTHGPDARQERPASPAFPYGHPADPRTSRVAHDKPLRKRPRPGTDDRHARRTGDVRRTG
ncbi:hypothetical protein, partial [Streptomyces sp. SID3915]|uniref:hypothetical protein n=1 Tax=Streptomyces sp. SID3915 TaxID=2690263 RepID=UPI001F3EA1EF